MRKAPPSFLPALAAISLLLPAFACSSSGDAPPNETPQGDDAAAPDSGNHHGSDGGSDSAAGDDDDDDSSAAPDSNTPQIPGWPPTDDPATAPPDFGPNVIIFDPSMAKADIQSQLDKISAKQNATTDNHVVGFGYGAEFSTDRYAILFKPGAYNADVKVGYYVQVLGLGHGPDDVTITGAVRVKADWRTDDPGDALLNFWRGAENMAVVPTLDSNTNVWGVSQATHLRRMHIKGALALSDGGWSSGGYIADSKIDTAVTSGTQQQFFTRNTDLTKWNGGSWNMVFVGDGQTPTGAWPAQPYTVVDSTPVIREKPFLFAEPNGNYYVMVPSRKTASQGPSWTTGAAPGYSLPIGKFYIAHPGTDTAATINAALDQGKHLLLTPGIYHVTEAIHVKSPDTVVLGLGLATLVPDKGTAALTIDDVDGVTVAGVVFDANTTSSPTLLQVGAAGAGADHSKDPTALFDVHCRVGGPIPGTASSCLTIHSNDVIIDHIWLWRSDDGAGVGWNDNKSDTGLIVNGKNVTGYGLFVEHFQKYQTTWNGDNGTVYFYQSEMPYDPPNQSSWKHDAVNGYASLKLGDSVTKYDGRGIGVYCVFDAQVVSENGVETPTTTDVVMQHLVTLRFGGANGSGINHIINGTGGAVNQNSMSARSTK